MAVFLKRASGKLNYTIDLSGDLGTDTISTCDWTATGGAVIESTSKTDTTATAVISGGEFGATSELTYTATGTTSSPNNLYVGTIVLRIL